MIRFHGMYQEWRMIFSDRPEIFLTCMLCLALLGGCASPLPRSSAVERDLPEMSSVVYVDISNNRQAVFFHSESVQMMPRLIVNYRGNPVFKFTKNYHNYAGASVLGGIGFMSTSLNSSDKKIIYEKMMEYNMYEYDTVSYMWDQNKKLPVLAVYEFLDKR